MVLTWTRFRGNWRQLGYFLCFILSLVSFCSPKLSKCLCLCGFCFPLHFKTASLTPPNLGGRKDGEGGEKGRKEERKEERKERKIERRERKEREKSLWK